MAIRRAKRPDSNFYILDKSISDNDRLSWRARGLLIYLLGKPDNWKVSVANLVNQTQNSAHRSGRDAIYSILKELEDIGYLQREQGKTDNGKFGSIDYVVSEIPVIREESPLTGNPDTAEPYTADPTLISIEYKQELKSTNKTLPPSHDVDKRVTPVDGAVAPAGTEETPVGNQLALVDSPSPEPDRASFDLFWSHYPRKVGKKEARLVWDRIKPSWNLYYQIIENIQARVDAEEWTPERKRYIPHAATYLSKERWEDEVMPAPASQPNRGNGYEGYQPTDRPRSAVDRVRSAAAQRERERLLRGNHGSNMDSHDRDIRQPVDKFVRRDAGRGLGDCIEGDFTLDD